MVGYILPKMFVVDEKQVNKFLKIHRAFWAGEPAEEAFIEMYIQGMMAYHELQELVELDMQDLRRWVKNTILGRLNFS